MSTDCSSDTLEFYLVAHCNEKELTQIFQDIVRTPVQFQHLSCAIYLGMYYIDYTGERLPLLQCNF